MTETRYIFIVLAVLMVPEFVFYGVLFLADLTSYFGQLHPEQIPGKQR